MARVINHDGTLLLPQDRARWNIFSTGGYSLLEIGNVTRACKIGPLLISSCKSSVRLWYIGEGTTKLSAFPISSQSAIPTENEPFF